MMYNLRLALSLVCNYNERRGVIRHGRPQYKGGQHDDKMFGRLK